MDIEWQKELFMILQVLLSFFLGAFVGWEREKDGSDAGIRTFGFIAMGSCIFGLMSAYLGDSDPARIAAQVVSGIGFICAGVIFHLHGEHPHPGSQKIKEKTTKGLTTAATLWGTAAMGMAVSFNMYVIAILSSFIMVTFLAMPRHRFWRKFFPSKHHPLEHKDPPQA
jgi:putative Mg2+ transporter-C (MgtC) family protein